MGERKAKGYLMFNNKMYLVYNGLNTIGRSPQAVVNIKNINISQHHAIITVLDDERHFISDMKSSNGTIMDHLKLIPLKLYPLKNGASIKLGDIYGAYKTIDSNIEALPLNDTQLTQSCSETFYGNSTQVLTYNTQDSTFNELPTQLNAFSEEGDSNSSIDFVTMKKSNQKVYGDSDEVISQIRPVTINRVTLFESDEEDIDCSIKNNQNKSKYVLSDDESETDVEEQNDESNLMDSLKLSVTQSPYKQVCLETKNKSEERKSGQEQSTEEVDLEAHAETVQQLNAAADNRETEPQEEMTINPKEDTVGQQCVNETLNTEEPILPDENPNKLNIEEEEQATQQLDLNELLPCIEKKNLEENHIEDTKVQEDDDDSIIEKEQKGNSNVQIETSEKEVEALLKSPILKKNQELEDDEATQQLDLEPIQQDLNILKKDLDLNQLEAQNCEKDKSSVENYAPNIQQTVNSQCEDIDVNSPTENIDIYDLPTQKLSKEGECSKPLKKKDDDIYWQSTQTLEMVGPNSDDDSFLHPTQSNVSTASNNVSKHSLHKENDEDDDFLLPTQSPQRKTTFKRPNWSLKKSPSVRETVKLSEDHDYLPPTQAMELLHGMETEEVPKKVDIEDQMEHIFASQSISCTQHLVEVLEKPKDTIDDSLVSEGLSSQIVRDILAEGLKSPLKPAVEERKEVVRDVLDDKSKGQTSIGSTPSTSSSSVEGNTIKVNSFKNVKTQRKSQQCTTDDLKENVETIVSSRSTRGRRNIGATFDSNDRTDKKKDFNNQHNDESEKLHNVEASKEESQAGSSTVRTTNFETKSKSHLDNSNNIVTQLETEKGGLNVDNETNREGNKTEVNESNNQGEVLSRRSERKRQINKTYGSKISKDDNIENSEDEQIKINLESLSNRSRKPKIKRVKDQEGKTGDESDDNNETIQNDITKTRNTRSNKTRGKKLNSQEKLNHTEENHELDLPSTRRTRQQRLKVEIVNTDTKKTKKKKDNEELSEDKSNDESSKVEDVPSRRKRARQDDTIEITTRVANVSKVKDDHGESSGGEDSKASLENLSNTSYKPKPLTKKLLENEKAKKIKQEDNSDTLSNENTKTRKARDIKTRSKSESQEKINDNKENNKADLLPTRITRHQHTKVKTITNSNITNSEYKEDNQDTSNDLLVETPEKPKGRQPKYTKKSKFDISKVPDKTVRLDDTTEEFNTSKLVASTPMQEAKASTSRTTSKRKNQLSEGKSETESPVKSRRLSANSRMLLLETSARDTARRILKPKVVFTMIDDPSLEAIVRHLGGIVVDNVSQCTVLVTDSVKRTHKLLCAVGQSKPIVSPNWLHECKKKSMFLDCWNFILRDREAEEKWNFSLRESLARSAETKLLEGHVFQLIVSTATDVLKGAIESCGGKVVTRGLANAKGKSFIVSINDNKAKYSKIVKQNEQIKVIEPEAIFDGTLRQEFRFNHFLLT